MSSHFVHVFTYRGDGHISVCENEKEEGEEKKNQVDLHQAHENIIS